MAEITICSAAEVDFTESLYWYASRDKTIALDFDSEFDRALTEIGNAPDAYPMCDDETHYFQMRRFPFRIIFRLSREQVVVIAVAHSSRSPEYRAER